MLAFIIINIIILALFAYFGLSVEASLIIIGVLWGLIIILATKSKQETQEKLGKLKIIKKEKNEKFEPTKIIEINTTSDDISMDFLINEKKEKFAISYCNASEKKDIELINAKVEELKKISNSDIEENEKKELARQVASKYDELINQAKNQADEDLCKFIEYNFDELIDYELLESTETKLQGKMLSTAGGALLFGGIGALIGMSGERKVKKNKEFIVVNLQLDDIDCPVFPIEFFNRNKMMGTEKYEKRLQNAKELCSMLLFIKNYSQKKLQKSNIIKNETELVTKLEQLAALKEKNIITEDEFIKMKTKLLTELNKE